MRKTVKKGFSPILIIIIVGVIAATGTAVFIAQKFIKPPANLKVETTNKSNPTPTPTPLLSDGEANALLSEDEQVSADAFNYDNPKYNLYMSYPSNYGYGVIDPNTTPYYPVPLLALNFSPKFTPGEETKITWQDNSLSFEDPMLFVFPSGNKSRDQYIASFKQRLSEENLPPKILSEKAVEVSGFPAYEIVTSTMDDEFDKSSTTILVDGKYAYEFVYYPKSKPAASMAILNSIRFQ